MKKKYNIICACCKKEFHVEGAKNRHRKYCSTSCSSKELLKARRKHLKNRICVCCGKVFHNRQKAKRFCSNECKNKYRHNHKKSKLVELSCKECGKTFKYLKYPSENERLYCSRKCQARGVGKRVRDIATVRNGYTAIKKQIICDECGKSYEKYITVNRIDSRNFCSNICYKKNTIKNISGGMKRKEIENTSQYERFKKAVLKRDNYTCQLCGETVLSSVIHVHHKIPISLSSLVACLPLNGIVLCKDCHEEIHYG